MNVEYHKWHSPALGQEMELKVYGHAGQPFLIFPSFCGAFYDFENYGMVESVAGPLEAGKIRLFAVHSVDAQSWGNAKAPPAERARRHQDYDRYIMSEALPFIHQVCAGGALRPITAGCSMGGYHAGNFFFRHPESFAGMLSLSGVFSPRLFVGDYMDNNVYFNSPLDFLPGLNDPEILGNIRRGRIIICTGQGAWEDQMVGDAHAMQALLAEKNIPAWVDFWGGDVNHDWPWWRKQFPYFIGRLLDESGN